MNTDEVRHIYETLQCVEWGDTGTGYIFDVTDPSAPSFLDLDAIYRANGLKPIPSATKAEMIEELRRRKIEIVPYVNAFDEALESEMRRQEDLVERIESCTKGLNEKIQNVISAMEDVHMQGQMQILMKAQELLKSQEVHPSVDSSSQ